MSGWLDHIPEVFGSRLSRLLLTAVGRNQKTMSIQFDEKGPRIEHSMFTTAIHFPKRPYFVLATGLSWNVPASEKDHAHCERSQPNSFLTESKHGRITS